MSTNNPAQTLRPTPGLVVANPQNSDKPLFCLFTEDWLKLQTFIVQTLQLPITTGDFKGKYGEFTDEDQVAACVAAMKTIQGLSASFGDPVALMSQLATDPTILQVDTPPAALYTHIVWYANKLNKAANNFNQTLGAFMEILKPANCGDPDSCLAILKDLLTGPSGLQSTAKDQVQKANDLVKALASFNESLKPSIDTMDDFTAKSSTFYKDVEAAITLDMKNVEQFQQAADDAYKQWRDYTISAVTTSVGLLIVTFGLAWPVSAILGGTLGNAAKQARDAYNKACEDVATANAEEQKKILLKGDLDAFNKQMMPTDEAADNFLKTLQLVAGVWSNISNNLAYIEQNFTVERIKDLSSTMEALELSKATQDWQQIAAASLEYTSHSLASYKIQEFGDSLPQAA